MQHRDGVRDAGAPMDDDPYAWLPTKVGGHLIPSFPGNIQNAVMGGHTSIDRVLGCVRLPGVHDADGTRGYIQRAASASVAARKILAQAHLEIWMDMRMVTAGRTWRVGVALEQSERRLPRRHLWADQQIVQDNDQEATEYWGSGASAVTCPFSRRLS